MALLTHQVQVSHKLHPYGDVALALAHLAASTLRVEGEIARLVAARFSQRLGGIELANLVVSLHISGRVAARRAPYGVLVHQLHTADAAQVARHSGALPYILRRAVKTPLQHIVQHLLHQARLSRPAHTRHHRQHSQREVHIHQVQIVAICAVDADAVPPRSAGPGQRNALLAQQVLRRQRLCRGLLHQLLRCAGKDHLATQASCSGADVNDIVSCTHDVLVVFHHNHRVAQIAQPFQHAYQAVRVARMQTDGRLVENIHAAHQRASQRSG